MPKVSIIRQEDSEVLLISYLADWKKALNWLVFDRSLNSNTTETSNSPRISHFRSLRRLSKYSIDIHGETIEVKWVIKSSC